MGDTGEKPYLPIGVLLDDARPRSDSPLGLPFDLAMPAFKKGLSVYVESLETDLSWPLALVLALYSAYWERTAPYSCPVVLDSEWLCR